MKWSQSLAYPAFALLLLSCDTIGHAQLPLPYSRPIEIAALSVLQPGQWSLRGRDATTPSKTLCIQDVRALLQIEHGRAQCSRFVIADGPNMAIVHYTCPGQGHGHTVLRVETPRLVQIESQGIINNEPFAVSFEARRNGECPAIAAAMHQR